MLISTKYVLLIFASDVPTQTGALYSFNIILEAVDYSESYQWFTQNTVLKDLKTV